MPPSIYGDNNQESTKQGDFCCSITMGLCFVQHQHARTKLHVHYLLDPSLHIVGSNNMKTHVQNSLGLLILQVAEETMHQRESSLTVVLTLNHNGQPHCLWASEWSCCAVFKVPSGAAVVLSSQLPRICCCVLLPPAISLSPIHHQLLFTVLSILLQTAITKFLAKLLPSTTPDPNGDEVLQ